MMKTWKLIGMMLLLAAGVVACTDETEEDPGGNGSGDTPEVPVVTPEDTVVLTAQMRTTTQEVPWREADSLSVLADTANWLFVTTTGGSPATFYGPAAEADVYYGLYPYQEEASLDNSSGALRLMAELPAEQRAVAGGYDYKLNMAAGVATDGSVLRFRLLCGFLRFNLSSCRGEVAEITMTGTSGLAGALTIDAEDRSVVSAEGTSVTLTAPEGGVFDRSVDYYLVVVPGTLEGVTFTFYDQEGNSHTSEVGTLAVTAGDVFDLTSVENFVPSDLAWGVTYDENYAHRFVDMIQYLDETDARTYGFNIGTTVLSEEGRAMFQELADEWCAGLTTDYEKAEAIRDRMQATLVQAGGGDQSPEAVWADGGGICQGWADLLKVFLHTQDIPCFGANGYLYAKGYDYGAAHAWTFAFLDGEWYLFDAMWNTLIRCSEVDTWGVDWEESTYRVSYQPQYVNVPMAEDGNFRYNFDRGVNIYGIKEGVGSEVTLPDVCDVLGGLDVTSFNLMEEVPGNVATIRLGVNISFIGEEETNLDNGSPSLGTFARNVKHFIVPEGNRTYWSDDEGCIYLGGREEPLHVPGTVYGE